MLVVLQYADVAELADALDLGSSVYDVQVQLLLSALPKRDLTGLFFHSANQIDPRFCYSYLNHSDFANSLI